MPGTKTRLQYEVARALTAVDDSEYRVEATDHEVEGQVYVAIFSGPDAKARAEEYAKFKNDAR
jgi:hypothetical protein